jgi:hypothetical protein
MLWHTITSQFQPGRLRYRDSGAAEFLYSASPKAGSMVWPNVVPSDFQKLGSSDADQGARFSEKAFESAEILPRNIQLEIAGSRHPT